MRDLNALAKIVQHQGSEPAPTHVTRRKGVFATTTIADGPDHVVTITYELDGPLAKGLK